MLKTTVLPKVTISSAEVTRQRTEIALMSYDRNVHQIKIPTDLTAGEIAKILVIFTFPFDESVIQLNGAWVDGHIQFTLPEILRTQRGDFYIEVNIDLTDSQITFARYRAKVVKSDIDVNASQATTVYFELFEDLVNEVADNAQQAKDVINLQNVDVEGHANTSKQTMDSDVNSVHDYSVSATTTIDAKVNTIEQAKTDAIQNIDDKVELVETTKKTALTSINEQVESVESAKGLAIDSINDEKTLAVNVVVQAGILAVGDVGAAQGSAIGAINGKVTNVDNAKKDAVTAIGEDVSAVSNLKTNALQSIADDTQSASDSLTTINGYQQTASDAVVAIEGHLANTTAKNELVDQKYSEFDSNVTTAGQTIDDMLGLADDVQQIVDEVLDLRIFVNQPNTDIFGVEVDVENKTFTRLLGAVDKTAGADFDSVKAFGGRRRCNVTDNGVVTAYFGETGYTETGALTVQVGTHSIGTKVQVMVEQPKFYYRTVPIKLEPISGGIGYHLRKARYYVSDTPRAGFALHPAFISAGEELDALYLSAYEGSLYDESTASYILDDAQVAGFATDRLSSVAGVKPISGLTQNLSRANARLLAQKRGEGWQQQYAATASLTQLLMLIEYNTFNLQTALGAGVIGKADSTGNESEPTGATALLGNNSGTAKTLNGYDAISYRGEENPYGNIYKFVDGLNVMANGIHQAYIADNAFADSKKDGSYRNVGFTLAKVNGYISAFGYSPVCDYLFLPSETLGNSAVPVGDYFYQNAVATDGAGWRTAYLSGRWIDGTVAGAFYLSVTYVFSLRARTIGARSVYARKKAVA